MTFLAAAELPSELTIILLIISMSVTLAINIPRQAIPCAPLMLHMYCYEPAENS